MDYTKEYNDLQKVNVVVKPVNAKGKTAAIQGVPEWTSNDFTVVEPVVNADGMSGWLVGVAAGVATVTITAKSLAGNVLTSTVVCTVVASDATGLELTLSEPEAQ